MGNGKKKIEIKKITKESSRMVTFSKRRKGLFKKAEELSSKTGAEVAILVYSPAGKPYTYGNVSSVTESFNGNRTNDNAAADAAVNVESATCDLKQWLENINVEACNNMDELMLLKQQLEEKRDNLMMSMVDYEFIQSLWE